MKIGVAISTHNRRPQFLAALPHWINRMPADAELVIVDDASDEPLLGVEGATVIRHDYRRGVAMTKNRGITELIDRGCTDLFLADDDCWPKTETWWRPYVDSPEPHLMYGWEQHTNRQRHTHDGWPPHITHQDQQHTAYSFPRGVMLYLHRNVVDTIGGMNTAHGIFSGEHVEYSQRAHTTGHTTWPFADITGSHNIWYARDREEGNTTNSTIPLGERRRLHRANGVHWDRQWDGWPWFPHREANGTQDYSLGPQLATTYEGTLDHILGCRPHGTALEFGVGEGHSLRRIAAKMRALAFDSFNGLPEDWRDGFPAGTFACKPPRVRNADIIAGLFEDTLPVVDWERTGPVGLVHIDCDLYTSTRTVLNHIGSLLKPGTYVVFDEWHGYEGSSAHEERAWREFADQTRIGWTAIGHGPEQWAIRIV